MPSKVLPKRSASPSAEDRQQKRPRYQFSSIIHPAVDAFSEPKIIIKIKVNDNTETNPAPSNMSSTTAQKRPSSPSMETPPKKRSRTGLSPVKSTAIGSVDSTSSKSKAKPQSKRAPAKRITPSKPETTKENVEAVPTKLFETNETSIKTKAEKDASFLVNLSSPTKPKLTKLPIRQPPIASETIEKDIPATLMQANDLGWVSMKTTPKTTSKVKATPKVKTNTTPRTNQFTPINTPSQKSIWREPLRTLESANVDVGSLERLNATDKELKNSSPLTTHFNHINSLPQKPAPPPRSLESIFGITESKAVALWMRSNKTSGIRDKDAFQELLYSLGCQDPSFDEETLLKLRHRLERFVSRMKGKLKESGAIFFREDDEFERDPIFADWTIVWEEMDWDGVYDTREYWADNYLEKYAPALEQEGEAKTDMTGLPVDEPFEEEIEIFVVEDPNEIRGINVTNSDRSHIRDPEYYSNPYGIADWK